ncbi:hypothetical protein [Novosphingobium sp.]|uniref:hypothetical protein n=1 Tax=Novosphingobium sp. TaxID=1874826 RepID=UPI0038BB7DF5
MVDRCRQRPSVRGTFLPFTSDMSNGWFYQEPTFSGANWLRNYGHLVPPGVEIWELDADSGEGGCLLGLDEKASNGGDHRAAPIA